MWNKRDDDASSRQPQTPPAPQPARPNGTASPAREWQSHSAMLGPGVVVKGEIFAREDLHLGGDLEGAIRLEEHRLTVGPNGRVRANIKAREVSIQGQVQGNVETTEKIVIHKDGSLVGDVKTAGIVIEDGAYFKGSIDITRPTAPKQMPQPAHPAGQG